VPVPSTVAVVVVGIDRMPLWLGWDTTADDIDEDNIRDVIVCWLGRPTRCAVPVV